MLYILLQIFLSFDSRERERYKDQWHEKTADMCPESFAATRPSYLLTFCVTLLDHSLTFSFITMNNNR